MKEKQKLGIWGESEAALFLSARGLEIIERNWRSVHGEIDIIAKDQQQIVFIEVKTRRADHFGYPEEAVDRKKREHLINCSACYIQEKQIGNEWRIDIISIRKIKDQPLEIEWFQDAVREE